MSRCKALQAQKQELHKIKQTESCPWVFSLLFSANSQCMWWLLLILTLIWLIGCHMLRKVAQRARHFHVWVWNVRFLEVYTVSVDAEIGYPRTSWTRFIISDDERNPAEVPWMAQWSLHRLKEWVKLPSSLLLQLIKFIVFIYFRWSDISDIQ